MSGMSICLRKNKFWQIDLTKNRQWKCSDAGFLLEINDRAVSFKLILVCAVIQKGVDVNFTIVLSDTDNRIDVSVLSIWIQHKFNFSRNF